MLTDYHLHLRPDDEGTDFERYFTTENVERYLAAAAAVGSEELGVS
jgi:histidinol-phosphatase (PHP family)